MTLCVVVKVVRHQGRTSPGRYLPTVGWTLSKNVPGWAKQCVVYYGLRQGGSTTIITKKLQTKLYLGTTKKTVSPSHCNITVRRWNWLIKQKSYKHDILGTIKNTHWCISQGSTKTRISILKQFLWKLNIKQQKKLQTKLYFGTSKKIHTDA